MMVTSRTLGMKRDLFVEWEKLLVLQDNEGHLISANEGRHQKLECQCENAPPEVMAVRKTSAEIQE